MTTLQRLPLILIPGLLVGSAQQPTPSLQMLQAAAEHCRSYQQRPICETAFVSGAAWRAAVPVTPRVPRSMSLAELDDWLEKLDRLRELLLLVPIDESKRPAR